MLQIGLIREYKTPPDTRVAFSPDQCQLIQSKYPNIKFTVEPSSNRCFSDDAYKVAGIDMSEDLSHCDVLIGIKEVPVDKLIEGKTYFFFSHTKKKQPYNQKLMRAMIQKKICMVDYECLTHADGQRILGFGFFAGVVGAHNGIMTFGKKHELFNLKAAHQCKDMHEMLEQYRSIRLPNFKIAVTGSGKVASGIIDVMTRLDIDYIEPEDFRNNQFDYPVYTHLKGTSLYTRKDNNTYSREDFHKNPQEYRCLFNQYLPVTDILMNGIYWDINIPRLFEKEEIQQTNFKISVFADITCDVNGSVPINIEASKIADPVYGIDKRTFDKTIPFQNTYNVVDVMAVDNLPNELPRDASMHFGNHLEKYILPELLKIEKSDIIMRATICKNGKLTPSYEYLGDYAYSE